jgi:CheY-like chemotaxis protein
LGEQISDPEQQRAVAAIRAAGERAAALTAQMLAYAGQHDLGERECIDLRILFSEQEDLLRATLSKRVRLSLSLEPNAFVLGSRESFTQVLMNLLANASDALEDHPGTILVRTELWPELPERWHGRVGPASANGYVELSVTDDGKGMSRETQAHVFDPFFTTKGGQGHGLGLAAAHGIVCSHGGALRVESTEGKGSRFSVLLPRAVNESKAKALVEEATPPQRCTVLVIDDEPLVRAFLTRALTHAGYSVEVAENGATALEAVPRVTPDLVLLDMTLPDLDGSEILRRIRQAGHSMPVVLASGYLATDVESALQPGSFQAFLQKPFRIDTLLRTVSEALARASTRAD